MGKLKEDVEKCIEALKREDKPDAMCRAAFAAGYLAKHKEVEKLLLFIASGKDEIP